MKLVGQKAELLIQQPGLEGLYKQIELAGRTCYKSEDKITEESAKPFVDRMIVSNHLAMLEHGTVYLKIDCGFNTNPEAYHIWDKYRDNKYSKCAQIQPEVGNPKGFVVVTTNLRVLIENDWMEDLQYLCEPTEYHEKRYTFKLTTSIGVTREGNRHRTFSIAEESTRYCNYSKNKYDNQITFCKPSWINLNTGIYECKNIDNIPEKGLYIVGDGYLIPFDNNSKENKFLKKCLASENAYMSDIEDGLVPQQARESLALCTKSEIVYTAFESDWKHFFDLRYFEKTGKVHPNMKEITTKMKEVAENAGIWDNIINK